MILDFLIASVGMNIMLLFCILTEPPQAKPWTPIYFQAWIYTEDSNQ